ncbi:GspH/FimT family pseudopilin [Marinobacterium arenosum]|uniref:GspH/FimT family pseudopilin n=1 Tax=Marinobacterium arenosum TaxID=2862496 RepID=UPI001C984856|nr:GspH/FimT family pseudopilin [Marinobacterium arenosum]MBY4675836.1 GspH/FimT family pseudopilin [Marinobacterium arenosum]
MKHSAGFTAVELLVSLTVITLLVGVALPSFSDYIDRSRLQSAAETIASDLYLARSEAVMRGVSGNITVSFSTDGATSWCYGLNLNSACDCSLTDTGDADACVLDTAGVNNLKVVSSSDYSAVSMTSANFSGATSTSFTSVRGGADSGQVVLQSASGQQLQVAVTALSRVRICSPAGNSYVTGYPTC